MHELSVAIHLIDLAREEADRRQVHVAALWLKVGPLSGVVREALVSAYEIARQGTPLADARLEFEETPVWIRCDRCGGRRRTLSECDLRCEHCRGSAAEILSGRELELVALEVETDDLED